MADQFRKYSSGNLPKKQLPDRSTICNLWNSKLALGFHTLVIGNENDTSFHTLVIGNLRLLACTARGRSL
jgi:hypothetical protein